MTLTEFFCASPFCGGYRLLADGKCLFCGTPRPYVWRGELDDADPSWDALADATDRGTLP